MSSDARPPSALFANLLCYLIEATKTDSLQLRENGKMNALLNQAKMWLLTAKIGPTELRQYAEVAHAEISKFTGLLSPEICPFIHASHISGRANSQNAILTLKCLK